MSEPAPPNLLLLLPMSLGQDPEQGTGVNQSPGRGRDYPFASPSDDVKYLLGDLWLAYDDDACGFSLPLKVTRLVGFAVGTPLLRQDVVVRDADGRTVFDSAAATFAYGVFGTRLVTMEWVGPGGVLRATRHLYPPQYAPDQVYADDFAPADGTLSARAVMRMPRRVRSLRVGLVKMSGNVVLKEGFNVSLAAGTPPAAEGGRFVRSVTVRANPGDGLGRQPGCQDAVPVLRRINTVPPTAGGDFTMDAEGCYRVQRPVAVTSTAPRRVALTDAHALQFYNDCAPCCTCDDFVRTYRGLTNLWNRFLSLGRQAEAVRDELAANTARWEAQRQCRLIQPLKLVLNAEPNCNLFVGGLNCNMTQCCAQPLVLRTTFEVLPARGGGLSLRCRETVRNGTDTGYEDRPYVPAGAFPVYDSWFDFSDPGSTSRFRFRVRLGDCVPGDSVRVTLSLHTPDVFGADGEPCPLPDPGSVPVPPGVAGLWLAQPPPFPVRAVLTKVAPISPTAGCGSCP